MSHWGVYDEVSPPHVLPVDAQGYAVNGHAVSGQCWCAPQVVKDARGNTVIVHQDKGRGGCDA